MKRSFASPQWRPKTRARMTAAAVITCYAVSPAWAQTPATITAAALQKTGVGNFTATQGSNSVDVYNLASRTIATAASFNVLAGETFRVHQNAASDAFMVRVTGQPGQALQQSVIAGNVWSNGQFWLVNAAGTIIKPGAVIDTARFVAALNVTDTDFLAGRLTFQNPTDGGKIVNQGTIKTPSGGSVYLIGTDVSNEGVITTPQGETILAAGQTVNLVDTGTPGVKVEITGASGNTTNLGSILADAGRIGMVGVIVRNSGILDASGTRNASTVVSEGGRVFLKASQDTYVDGSGRIVATGTKGGRAEVLGNRVAVMDNASIDVSGAYGGGTVLVGGDYQGKNPDVQNANISYFGSQASIKADASDNGDGGKVIVWADDTTRAYGTISARGGANGGNGGFVETSGHRVLDFAGAFVDTRAPNGAIGNWLLDPADLSISHATGPSVPISGGVFAPSSTPSTTTDYDINQALASSSVTIETSGTGGSGNIDITNATIQWTPTASKLTLLAYGGGSATGNINISNSYIAGYGDLVMAAGWNGSSTTSPSVISGKGNLTVTDSLVAARNVSIKTGGSLDVISYGGNPFFISSNSVAQQFNHDIGSGIVATGSTGTPMDATVYGSIHLTNANSSYWYGGNSETPSVFLASYGGQTINLAGSGSSVYLDAGSSSTGASYGGPVRLVANGDQSIVFSGGGSQTLSLYGGDGSTPGEQAVIASNGVQLIDGRGTTLDIILQGGSANANLFYSTNDNNIVICKNCETDARAEIRSNSSSATAQTIYGSSITLQAGGGGNGNGAEIKTEYGGQYINVTGAITLTGGPTGGAYYGSYYGGTFDGQGVWSPDGVYATSSSAVNLLSTTQLDGYISNDANIGANHGTSNIYAGSVSINGGGNSSSYGGSHIGGATLYLTTTGDVLLQGGTGAAPRAGDFNGFVAVGNDNAFYGTLNIGGTLGMYGGTMYGAEALIGSLYSTANVKINAYGGAIVGSLGASANTEIGSRNGSGGSVAIYGGYSSNVGYGGTAGINLNTKSFVFGIGDTTLYSYGGSIVQDTYSKISATTLTAGASRSSGQSIYLAGSNHVGTVTSLNGYGGVTYYDVNSTIITAANAVNGNIAIRAGYFPASGYFSPGYNLTVGNLTASGTVDIQAGGAVLQSSASSSISGSGISLTSYYGGAYSGLAISARTSTAGALSAQVYGDAVYGGIAVTNIGAEPTSVSLTDASSATSGHLTSYVTGNAVSLNGTNYVLASRYGNVLLSSSQGVTITSLAGLQPAYGNMGSGMMTVSGGTAGLNAFFSSASTAYGDVFLGSGGTTSISGSLNASNGSILMAGASVYVYGGTVSAKDDVGIFSGGSINIGYMGGDVAIGSSSITAGSGHWGNIYLGGGGGLTAAGGVSFSGSAGSINLYGGNLVASASGTYGGAIYAATGGDVILNPSSSMAAGLALNIALNSSTSKLQLSGSGSSGWGLTTYAPSAAISVSFPLRARGGIFVNGVETDATSTVVPGFFANTWGTTITPAVSYGVKQTAATAAATTSVIAAITSATSSTPSSTTTSSGTSTTAPPPPPPATTTTSSTSLASLGNQTVGGGTGQFGGTDSSTSSTTTTSSSMTGSTSTTSGSTTTSSSSGSGTNGDSSGSTTSSSSSSTSSSSTSSSSESSGSTSSSSSSSDDKGSNGKKDEKKEDKKDDKKSSDSGEKKDDKSGKKTVGKCTA